MATKDATGLTFHLWEESGRSSSQIGLNGRWHRGRYRGIGGFVGGEFFGGEVTLGATGLVGAYLGAHVGAAVGAVNGLTQGAVLASICYAGFQYDN